MFDAFDFFLVVFALERIAGDLGTNVKSVTYAIFLTLAMRPLGAFLFGRWADHIGRRPVLMMNVVLYSVMEFASAFAPTLTVFLVLRALFGIAMGGEWGVGASLAMESIPARSRGAVSGILQSGYPTGYLMAAIIFGLLYEHIGWRGMLMVGAAPAILVLWVLRGVPESKAWVSSRATKSSLWAGLAGHWRLLAYAVVLMTVFNFFSHGTQDLYPTVLRSQRGFPTATISRVAIVYNIGAICGGLFVGWLSGRIGRRRAIALAALLALPVLPFWTYGGSAVALGAAAFFMQIMVQGAWAAVPAHLNELSPPSLRATFPGVVYQLGNLLASSNATLQAVIAIHHGSEAQPDYAFALTLVCGIIAPSLALLALLGPERRDVRFTA
jgi:SHS family lactate transporter-like MFS transporter